LLGIDAVFLIDWSDRLDRKYVKKIPFLDVRKVASSDLDTIEKASREGFEVQATIGTTVLLLRENY
jgi:hypothetical protein